MPQSNQLDTYRVVFDQSPQAMLILHRADLRVLAANRSALQLLDRTIDQVLGGSLLDLSPGDSRDALAARWAMVERGGETEICVGGPGPEGGFRTLSIRSTSIEFERKPAWLVGLTDVSAYRDSEAALQRSEERFRAIFEHSADVVTLTDRSGRCLFVSGSVERVLGWTPAELVGRSLFDQIHPDDLARTVDAFADGRDSPETVATLEYRIRNRSGAWLTMEASVSNLLDNPSVGAIIIHARDITLHRAAESRIVELQGVLYNLSLVDPNTGLHNRRGLLTFGEHRLQLVNRLKQPMVLTIVELRNLDEINQQLGAAAGDQAVGEITATLQATFRKTDILARLTDNSFGILAMIRTPDDARFFLGRLFDQVEALNQQPRRPFQLILDTGSAVYDPRAPGSFTDLMTEAEETLSRARRARDAD